MTRIERILGFFLAVIVMHGGAAAAQRAEPSGETAWAGGASCSQAVIAMQGLRDERGACTVGTVVVAQLDGSQTVTYQGRLMTMAELAKLFERKLLDERMSDAQLDVELSTLVSSERAPFKVYLDEHLDRLEKELEVRNAGKEARNAGKKAERAKAIEDNKRAEAERAKAIEDNKRAEAELAKAIEDNKRAEAERAKAIEDNKRAEAERAKAIEDNKRAEAELAKAIDRFASKVPEVVAGYEELLRRGQKLMPDDARILKWMLEYGKPPSFMARAEKLLSNPNNFTGPEKSR